MRQRLQHSIIAIDGPSGIGKSTVITLVAEMLENQGYLCTKTANNAAGPFETVIRALSQEPTAAYSLALATAAARAYINETISSQLLLCDRHVLSTFVYQGFAGMPFDYLYAMNAPFLNSALFILLALPEADLNDRRTLRAQPATDWFKRKLVASEEIARFNEAADALAARGHKVIRIPAVGNPEQVASRIVAEIGRAKLGKD